MALFQKDEKKLSNEKVYGCLPAKNDSRRAWLQMHATVDRRKLSML